MSIGQAVAEVALLIVAVLAFAALVSIAVRRFLEPH
jgi:hypothetical protein